MKQSARQADCPRCGKQGKSVKVVTLESLLSEDARARAEDATYRYCETASCEIVYFAEEGESLFEKDELTVRVGAKETSAPRQICYCFDHSMEEIDEQVKHTGTSTVLDEIKVRLKDGCWCETKNPQGGCCLGAVSKYIETARERNGKETLMSVDENDGKDCSAAGAHSDAATKEATDAPATADRRAQKFALLGTVLSAMLASACCWLPLLLLAFGVSGVAVSAAFEQYRPWFIGITFVFLAAGFYFVYRPRSAIACNLASGTASCCPPPGTKGQFLHKLNETMLWVVTILALSFVFLPNYVGLFLGGRTSLAADESLEKVSLNIEGMTCAGCTLILEKALTAIPGIVGAKVSFDRKEATVGVAPGGTMPREQILATISTGGFKGEFKDFAKFPKISFRVGGLMKTKSGAT